MSIRNICIFVCIICEGENEIVCYTESHIKDDRTKI